ncbi:FliO/MopB family protein [Candidatus Peregrinibacteria bacterium]|nr:FliO/MopB family protein [Candidatus Peregrinibacteria bacterium]
MKRAVIVLTVFSLSFLDIFAQEKGVTILEKDGENATNDTTNAENRDSAHLLEKKVSVPSKSIFDRESEAKPITKSNPLSESREREPEFSGLFLWTFLVLGMIIGCYFIFRKVVAGSRFFGSFNVINVLAKKQISPKHTVYLVEIGKKIILLSATKDGMATLSEFTNPDEIAIIRAKCPGGKRDSEENVFKEHMKENLAQYEKEEVKHKDISTFKDTLEEMKKTVDNWKV